MNRNAFLIAMLLCSVMVAGCAGGAPAQPAAPGVQDQYAATVVGTVEAVAAQGAATPSLVRGAVTVETGDDPAQAINSQCPRPAQATAPQKPAEFKDIAQGLAAYLSAGATLEDVSMLMQTWGVKFASPGTNEPLGSIEYAKIMPGEDAQVIATFYDPAPGETISRPGNLAVFSCVGGAYQVAYQALTDSSFEGLVTDPRVLDVSDVSGDGLMDLSFLTGDCGAATCMEGVTILAAHGGQALRNLAPEFAFVPYPTFEYVPSASGTARDLVVVEGILGDPTAGPQRSITSTWQFNGNVFTRTAELKEAATYRIHALHDGDDALRAKDYRLADSLYGSVIAEPALQSWDANPNVANEPAILGAFAYVRLMQSAALRGDVTGVNASFDSLQSFGPADSLGYLYTQLGEAFINAWRNGNNYEAGCAAMIGFANSNPNVTRWLGIEAFGSANYDYQAEDLCLR
jgi:hypothetical protein